MNFLFLLHLRVYFDLFLEPLDALLGVLLALFDVVLAELVEVFREMVDVGKEDVDHLLDDFDHIEESHCLGDLCFELVQMLLVDLVELVLGDELVTLSYLHYQLLQRFLGSRCGVFRLCWQLGLVMR